MANVAICTIAAITNYFYLLFRDIYTFNLTALPKYIIDQINVFFGKILLPNNF